MKAEYINIDINASAAFSRFNFPIQTFSTRPIPSLARSSKSISKKPLSQPAPVGKNGIS